MSRILRIAVHINNALHEASDVAARAAVIVYPTDTFCGIGADALNAAAVQNVLPVMKRKDDKAILVMVNPVVMLHRGVHSRVGGTLDASMLARAAYTRVYGICRHPEGTHSIPRNNSSAFSFSSVLFRIDRTMRPNADLGQCDYLRRVGSSKHRAQPPRIERKSSSLPRCRHHIRKQGVIGRTGCS